MSDPTVARIYCANNLLVFVALRFAIEVAHHDRFFGHGRRSFTVAPILIGQMPNLDRIFKQPIARPGTAVRLSVSVAFEPSVDLQEALSGRDGREVDGINPQRTRRRVDDTLDSSGVHIEMIHRAQLRERNQTRRTNRPAGVLETWAFVRQMAKRDLEFVLQLASMQPKGTDRSVEGKKDAWGEREREGKRERSQKAWEVLGRVMDEIKASKNTHVSTTQDSNPQPPSNMEE